MSSRSKLSDDDTIKGDEGFELPRVVRWAAGLLGVALLVGAVVVFLKLYLAESYSVFNAVP